MKDEKLLDAIKELVKALENKTGEKINSVYVSRKPAYMTESEWNEV